VHHPAWLQQMNRKQLLRVAPPAGKHFGARWSDRSDETMTTSATLRVMTPEEIAARLGVPPLPAVDGPRDAVSDNGLEHDPTVCPGFGGRPLASITLDPLAAESRHQRHGVNLLLFGDPDGTADPGGGGP
jgi:hypothetical protein